jgi:hypothetical protein
MSTCSSIVLCDSSPWALQRSRSVRAGRATMRHKAPATEPAPPLTSLLLPDTESERRDWLRGMLPLGLGALGA